MKGWAGLLLLLPPLLGGCVYLNSLYNAERLFEEGERDRLFGREAEARVRYDSVVSKAARSYRKEPEGDWADDALYLLGRAYLRLGDLPRARAALERARAMADDQEVRVGSLLYLGVVASRTGDPAGGVALLNEAIREIDSDRLRGEGHLWRARVLLGEGRIGEGWWDLDRAGEADGRLVVPADVERIVWGLIHGDTVRARRGAERLLARGDAFSRGDTLRALARRASDVWGPAAAADLLEPATDAPWPPRERDQTLLLRARLRAEAGDTAGAEGDATLVAGGVGPDAVAARLMLAHLRLARVTRPSELDGIRPVLLPAVGDPRVLVMLESIRKVELLVRDADRPGREVARFAAAEMARDELGAPALARFLFIEYADRSGEPWRGKALLAALSLGRDEGDRRMLRGRLVGLEDDPYVAAARGRGASQEFQRLEQDLDAALGRVLADASAEAAQLDVLVRERSDTIR